MKDKTTIMLLSIMVSIACILGFYFKSQANYNLHKKYNNLQEVCQPYTDMIDTKNQYLIQKWLNTRLEQSLNHKKEKVLNQVFR